MSQYTTQQRSVIAHAQGNALIYACPGAGKTTTLVAREARQISDDPTRPLRVLTFNRDAANGFRSRLRERVGGEHATKVQTYHSLGLGLTRYLTKLGFLEPAAVDANPRWLRGVAASALHEAKRTYHGGRRSELRSAEVDDCLQFYDRFLAGPHTPRDTVSDHDPPYFAEVAERLEERRRSERTRTLGHLLRDPVLCLRDNAAARALVADRLDELAVDEFQDINTIQYELVRILAGGRARVIACGDADQTIYAWRGARIDLITERFHHDFAPVTEYRLDMTMRHGDGIAAPAAHVIRHNRIRPDMISVPARTTPASETERVTAEPGAMHALVRRLLRCAAGRRWSDVAVLCRRRTFGAPVQVALRGAGIPYRVDGQANQLFNQTPMAALRGLLRIAAGAFGDQAHEARQAEVAAVLAYPSLGLNRDAIGQIAARVAARPDDLQRQLLEGSRYTTLRDQQEAITNRAHLIGALACPRWRNQTAKAVLNHYARMTKLTSSAVSNHITVSDCSCHSLIAVLEQLDDNDEAADAAARLDALAQQDHRAHDDNEAIEITTIHRAKGLEWPIVVVPGLSEGQFPSELDDAGDIEAERRLFYVALTRAEERAILCVPRDHELERFIAGTIKRWPKRPKASRFVYEAAPGWALASVARGETHELVATDVDCARRYLAGVGLAVQTAG